MSDAEDAPNQPAAAEASNAEAMDINKAVQEVLKTSLANDGLVRGLRQVVKTLEEGEAQLCILAQDVDNPEYKRLIESLCTEKDINLISVPTAKQLGEWAGQCKIDSEGKARKIIICGCCVITDYGAPSQGFDVLQDYMKAGCE